MAQKVLNDVLGFGDVDPVWELFHENSKISRYDVAPSDEDIQAWMINAWESLNFDEYPLVSLPTKLTPLKASIEEAMISRASARRMTPCLLTVEDIATILYFAYGITRDNKNTNYPRPFRTVPSAGALYPLEIFFHSVQVENLEPGTYHYNPTDNSLRFLRKGDESHRISKALVQENVALDASLILFITAMFERTTFKYGNRGYRFVMLEAGHVAQNINLVSKGLGLGSLNVGGFFDRNVDEFLGLNGITHSTIYVVAIGRQLDDFSPSVLLT